MDGCISTMNGSDKIAPIPNGRGRKTIKAKSFKQTRQSILGSSPVLCKGQRKTLQVIQPGVSCSKTKLVETTNRLKSTKRKHNSGTIDKPTKISRCELNSCKFPIYEDPTKPKSASEDKEQKPKTAEEEAWELMVQETAPETYWKDLAEVRRVALEDTLKENEQLHETITELRTENGRLQEMADQAEYLASVLENVIQGKSIDSADGEHPDDTERRPEEVDEHVDAAQRWTAGGDEAIETIDGEQLTDESCRDWPRTATILDQLP